jgi:hypothetical protein
VGRFRFRIGRSLSVWRGTAGGAHHAAARGGASHVSIRDHKWRDEERKMPNLSLLSAWNHIANGTTLDGERTNEQERTRAPNQHGEAAAAGLEQINPVHPSELLLCTSASKQGKKIKCKKD